jgi:hypothetical protein
MALLVGIVVIVLGLVVVGLDAFFTSSPEGWQLVSLIFGGVAILIGVPVLVQMLIGRAKLIVEFNNIVEKQRRLLGIFLKNPQLGDASTGKKSIWRKLGVKRNNIESLTVSFSISEVGSGKVWIPIMHARIYSDADSSEQGGSWRVTVPPTLTCETSVIVAMWNDSEKVAIVPGDRLRGAVELPEGFYQIEAMFVVDGEPKIRFRRFIVGATADDLTWVKQDRGKGDSQT